MKANEPDGRDSGRGAGLAEDPGSGAPDIGGRGNGLRIGFLDLVMVGGGTWNAGTGSALLGASSHLLNSGSYDLDFVGRSSVPMIEALGPNDCACPE